MIITSLTFIMVCSVNAAAWRVQTGVSSEVFESKDGLYTGRILIATQNRNEFTLIHADEIVNQSPGNWDGLVHINRLIDGMSEPPNRWASGTLEHSRGNSTLYPLTSNIRLDSDSESQAFIVFPSLSLIPVAATGSSLKSRSDPILFFNIKINIDCCFYYPAHGLHSNFEHLQLATSVFHLLSDPYFDEQLVHRSLSQYSFFRCITHFS